MNDQKHPITPGPWKYEGGYIWGTSVGGISMSRNEHMVGQVRGWGHLQYLGTDKAIAVQEANGELLARAPELLVETVRLAAEIRRLKDSGFEIMRDADAKRHALSDQCDAQETEIERWKWLEEELCDLRCVSEPTGGDDCDVAWVVIEHYEAAPQERQIGYGRTPQEAIDDARNREEEK